MYDLYLKGSKGLLVNKGAELPAEAGKGWQRHGTKTRVDDAAAAEVKKHGYALRQMKIEIVSSTTTPRPKPLRSASAEWRRPRLQAPNYK